MSTHPVHRSNIPGVRTANNNHLYDLWRPTEGACIIRENIKNSAKLLPLCKLHILPEGIVCDARVNKDGIYFCSKGKEGCPIKI